MSTISYVCYEFLGLNDTPSEDQYSLSLISDDKHYVFMCHEYSDLSHTSSEDQFSVLRICHAFSGPSHAPSEDRHCRVMCHGFLGLTHAASEDRHYICICVPNRFEPYTQPRPPVCHRVCGEKSGGCCGNGSSNSLPPCGCAPRTGHGELFCLLPGKDRS